MRIAVSRIRVLCRTNTCPPILHRTLVGFIVQRIFAILLMLVLLTGTVANPRYIPQLYAAQQTVTSPSTGVLYFSETGQYLHGTFRQFYEANGGVTVFGLPLTPIVSDGALRVQYFERARFEVPVGHDDAGEVMLTRIGAHFINQLSDAELAQQPFAGVDATANDASIQYFAPTRHTLRGAFRTFWEQNGALPILGYPMSEEFVQQIQGEMVRVQYFERVRLEMRFTRNNQTRIDIGLLGTALLLETPEMQVHTAPMPSMELVASATTSYKGAGQAKRTNIARAGAMVDGVIIPAGSEFSFLANSNFVDTDFVEGYGIINGQLTKVIGGGICQVSTTLFRAASNGGFDITRRIPPTYVVTTYEDILGFDAAVLEPGVDFRFRNDSANLLMLVVRNSPSASRITMELWGVPDGRTVQYDGPFVTNVTKPGSAIWQYDATIARGTTRQLVVGRGGMNVSYMRKVFAADGNLLHDDTFLTKYAPWYDYVLYGPGVVPPAGVRLR